MSADYALNMSGKLLRLFITDRTSSLLIVSPDAYQTADHPKPTPCHAQVSPLRMRELRRDAAEVPQTAALMSRFRAVISHFPAMHAASHLLDGDLHERFRNVRMALALQP